MTTELPRLADVFRGLSRGRHICIDDGESYWALKENVALFHDLFEALGFKLIAHQKNFFYFEGDERLSDASARLVVFVFILVEWLGDAGVLVEEELLRREFSIQELPHFATDRYRSYMVQVGVTDHDQFLLLVKTIERLGIAQLITESRLRFRTPIYRFLDLCLKADGQTQTSGST